MIISASRRTDIPSYYSQWLENRLKEEYVFVRNPMNFHQISRISLSPDVVDGIVFWTKNPAPMLKKLPELEKYNYYFQFTLTSYGPEVERNLPSKNKILIPMFQQLSKEIGRERIVWRYDPIFLSKTYTMAYHRKYFEVLASKLAPYTEKCTVSFLDMYKNTLRNTKPLHIQPITTNQQIELLECFMEISQRHQIQLDTCAEIHDFSKLGIRRACCVDRERFEKIGKCRLNIKKDKNQRKACKCDASIDIGAYHTCKNGCLYCYANDNPITAIHHFQNHDPKSPLLYGKVTAQDTVKERDMQSALDGQMTLFDI